MRCEECTPYKTYINGKLHCRYWKIPVEPNDFCTIGEKWKKNQEWNQRGENSLKGSLKNSCDELTTLRSYKNTYVQKLPNGEKK